MSATTACDSKTRSDSQVDGGAWNESVVALGSPKSHAGRDHCSPLAESSKVLRKLAEPTSPGVGFC